MEIPGQTGWSVTGDKTVEFAKTPLDFVENRMKKYQSRVFLSRVLNKPHIFVTSNKGVKEILIEKSSVFTMGYKEFGYMYALYGDLFIFEDDENAFKVRNIVKELFKPSHCDVYMKTIRSIIEEKLSKVHVRSSLDVYELFKEMITRICLAVFLDMGSDEAMIYKEIATLHWHGLISVPVNLKIKGWSSSYSKAEEAKAVLIRKIKEKLHSDNKEKGRFLQLIPEAGFQTAEEAYAHVLLFISSIIPKAMSSLLTSFVLEMAGDGKNHMRKKALDDQQYLTDLLTEVQRLYPPLYGGRRYACQDVVIDGYKIPKGHYVAYITKFANRDTTVFEQGDKFLPERWENGAKEKRDLIWTFGAGSRSCIGTHFTNAIMNEVSKYLLERYDWRIVSGKVPVYKTLPVARPKDAVQVAFYPKEE